MTLFWFLTGLALIIGISRYNEDDNLFWKLFIAFVGSFAAATTVKYVVENKKQDKIVVVESAPTQVLESTPGTAAFRLADVSLSVTKGVSPKPVSKDSTLNENDSVLSKVFGSARGQPQLCMYYDDS